MPRARRTTPTNNLDDGRVIIPLETIKSLKDIEAGMFADVTLVGSVTFDGIHKFKKSQCRTITVLRDIAYYWKRQSHFSIMLYKYDDEEDEADAKAAAKKSPVAKRPGVGLRKRAIKRRR